MTSWLTDLLTCWCTEKLISKLTSRFPVVFCCVIAKTWRLQFVEFNLKAAIYNHENCQTWRSIICRRLKCFEVWLDGSGIRWDRSWLRTEVWIVVDLLDVLCWENKIRTSVLQKCTIIGWMGMGISHFHCECEWEWVLV